MEAFASFIKLSYSSPASGGGEGSEGGFVETYGVL